MVADFKKYTTNYRFDLMANSIYDFVWNEYCDWYLEIAKNNINETTKNNLIFSIVRIIKICHPIIPFITEDIWKEFYKKGFVTEPMLINSSFPSQIRISKEYDIESRVENIRDIINFVEKNKSYFIDTVVYSKHLRFFDFKEKIPLENLKKYLLQRI